MKKIVLLLASALLVALSSFGRAQELREELTPFTAWLDFPRLAAQGWPRFTAQWWLESITTQSGKTPAGIVETTFRLRLRALRDLDQHLQLRVFFTDHPDSAPTVRGLSETGSESFTHEFAKTGLGLATSETVTVPTRGVDLLEIRVAGDGKSVRGVFLALLKTQEIRRAVDFGPAPAVTEPFGKTAPLESSTDDATLFGRVTATLDQGPVKLTAEEASAGVWEFELQAPPLIAIVSFEIANPDSATPLQAKINDRPLGAVSVQWPDLADPGYLGIARPLQEGLRFQYTGWLRAQVAIPGAALRAGSNRLVLRLPAGADPAAIRTVQLQLKYPWKNFDYTLAPQTP